MSPRRSKSAAEKTSRKVTADALRKLRKVSRDLKVHQRRVNDAEDANLKADRNRIKLRKRKRS